MEVIKRELEGTPLHQLAAKMEELGVGDAFKHGKKKAELIKEAIALLEKRAQAEVIEDETKDTEVDDTNEDDEVQGSEEIKGTEGTDDQGLTIKPVGPEEGAQEGIIPPTIEAKKDTEASFKMSRKDIEKNIANCKLNMIGSNDQVKRILLDKIEALEEML